MKPNPNSVNSPCPILIAGRRRLPLQETKVGLVIRTACSQPGAVLVSDEQYSIENTIHKHDKIAPESRLYLISCRTIRNTDGKS